MNRVIVSRHRAAVEFIKENRPDFADAPVLASATIEDVAGKFVAGNIPLSLASKALAVLAVEFDGPAPRGAEYKDMKKAGAYLAAYKVTGQCPATWYEVIGEEIAEVFVPEDVSEMVVFPTLKEAEDFIATVVEIRRLATEAGKDAAWAASVAAHLSRTGTKTDMLVSEVLDYCWNQQ